MSLKHYLICCSIPSEDGLGDLDSLVTAETPEQALRLWGDFHRETGFVDGIGEIIASAGPSNIQIFQVPEIGEKPHVYEWHSDLLDIGKPAIAAITQT